MTDLNIIAIILATVAQFIVGAIWYMPLFGATWGKIHSFNKLDKKTQNEMAAKMGPYYGVQFLVTLITTIVLAKLMVMLPTYSPYSLAIMCWIGFILPTQASGVIFGGTPPQWIGQKIAIMAGAALTCLFVAASILNYF